MASFTETCAERLIIGDPIDADSIAGAGTDTTGSIDMSKCHRAIFIMSLGDMVSSSTVDMKLQESADDSTWTDVSGGSGNSITQLTEAGSDDNKVVTLEIRGDQLGTGKRYVRAHVTVGTAASELSVIALGMDPVYHPGSDHNNAAVDEQVVKS